MSQTDTIDGETIVRAVENLQAIIDGDMDTDSKAVEEAKELGLTDTQRAVAERYAGEGRVTVDSSRIPNLAEKLAAAAELPWTFVLDSVEFVVKAGCGAGRNPSEWSWMEDDYRFTFYKYSDRENQIRVSEASA